MNTRIGSVLPEFLANMVLALTQTADTLEALRRLCDMGRCDLALILLYGVASSGGNLPYFMLVPPNAKIESCRLENLGDTYWLYIDYVDSGGDDTVCFRLRKVSVKSGDEKQEFIYVAPCSRRDYTLGRVEATLEAPPLLAQVDHD